MSHVRLISRPRRPAVAASRLEKQATMETLQQGITQLVAFVNILIGLLSSR